MTNVAETLRRHSEYLRPDPTARLDTEVLLAHCLGVDRTTLFREPERKITSPQAQMLNTMVAERKKGRPIAQLVGKSEFYSLEFAVSADVLTPRADTELLVDHAIQIAHQSSMRIADLGTGSGAVGVSIATHCPDSTIYAVDICPQALAVAGANLNTHQLDNLHLIRADWLSALAPNTLDIVVSNPPYIESDDPHMRNKNIAFEPKLALDGGEDGLEVYRRLIPEARNVLKSSGHLVLEHGYRQGPAVRQLLESAGFTDIVSFRDLSRHERITRGIFNTHTSATTG